MELIWSCDWMKHVMLVTDLVLTDTKVQNIPLHSLQTVITDSEYTRYLCTLFPCSDLQVQEVWFMHTALCSYILSCSCQWRVMSCQFYPSILLSVSIAISSVDYKLQYTAASAETPTHVYLGVTVYLLVLEPPPLVNLERSVTWNCKN